MIQVSILEDDDVLLASDWCRPLLLTTMDGGRSDFMSFESPYSGAPENNVLWVRADQVLSAWIGKTVGEIRLALERFGGHEFLRGALPKGHTMLSKSQQAERRRLRDLPADTKPLSFGKHRGRSPSDLLGSADGRRYLSWLADNTEVLSESMRMRVADLP